jgi:hypothetical protein
VVGAIDRSSPNRGPTVEARGNSVCYSEEEAEARGGGPSLQGTGIIYSRGRAERCGGGKRWSAAA